MLDLRRALTATMPSCLNQALGVSLTAIALNIGCYASLHAYHWRWHEVNLQTARVRSQGRE
jgi:hypothetical protein